MELDTLTTGSVGAGSRVVAPPAIAEPLLEAGRRDVNALARAEMSALVPLTRDEEAAAEPEAASAGVPSAVTAAGAAARPMSSCAIALQEPRTNSRVSQPSWTGSAHRCQCELCASQYVGSDTPPVPVQCDDQTRAPRGCPGRQHWRHRRWLSEWDGVHRGQLAQVAHGVQHPRERLVMLAAKEGIV